MKRVLKSTALVIALFSTSASAIKESQNSHSVDQKLPIQQQLINSLGKNNFELVLKEFIASGNSLDYEDETALSPLHKAIEINDHQAVKLLINNGANVDLASSKNGWTPLITAIYFNRVDMVRFLLESGADVLKSDEHGWAPIHFTVNSKKYQKHNGTKLAEILIKAGASVNQLTKTKRTPLMYAVLYDHLETAKLLLKNSADVSPLDVNGETVYYYIVTYNRLDMLKAFIAAGADISVTDEVGGTPLHRAVTKNKAAIVKTLINAGADVNWVNNYGETALHLTVQDNIMQRQDRTEIASLLIAAKAKLNQKDKNGFTPLLLAIENKRLLTLKLLAESGANVNVTDINGLTPLHIAAIHNLNSETRMLIEAGAKLDQKNKNGFTPLIIAIAKGHLETLNVLVEIGANVNIKDGNGNSPLHYAANFGYHSGAKMLIEAGADVSSTNLNKHNETPLDYAEKNEFHSIVELIKQGRR